MADEKVDKAEVEEKPVHHAEGLINEEKQAHMENDPGSFSMRFQVIATIVIVITALVGGVVGVIMSNNKVNSDVTSWIGLPGDLFIRSLKCVVLPLVFVNVILAVIQMIEAGKAGAVGKWTVIAYFCSTLVASIEGLVAVAIFKDRFSRKTEDETSTFVNFMCPDGTYLVEDDGDIFCAAKGEYNKTAYNFEVDNVNGYFQTTGDDFNVITFSQTLQDGIFKKLVPDNIVGEFATGGFVGVVMFGIVFGAASQMLTKKPVLIIDFLQDVNDILVKIIQWIIYLTPIAVFSLIAGALGAQVDLAKTFSDIGVLVTASVVAFFAHILVIYPIFFFLIVRKNPYAYLRHIIPAQIFAFSCSSSAATLPVTLRCVRETGQVPDSIRDFVLPIGATVNMDGTALYFPPALVFLAITSGFEEQLDAAAYFLIILVSTIGSAGAAPVPNAGLVLIITAFNTVFNQSGTPANFAIIVGIDWLMDRCQTALNVTGDTLVARIVTKLTNSDVKAGHVPSELEVAEEEVVSA